MNEIFYFTCPHCKQGIRVPKRFEGFRGACKLCGGTIVPREPVEAPPATQPAAHLPVGEEALGGGAIQSGEELPLDSHLPYRPEREATEEVVARVKKEAMIVSHNNTEPLMLHQAYALLIKHYWEHLHKGYDCLELLIQACAQQTEISRKVMEAIRESTIEVLPVHRGYLYLARVRLRQGLYQKSAQLCDKAMEEGWPGRWKEIIELCEAQLDARDYQNRMAYIMGNSGPGSNP